MNTSRRKFLKGAAIAAFTPVTGFPAVVKRKDPNSMLSHACVGTGNMAWSDLDGIKSHKEVHITALCDVDANYLERAKKVCPDTRVYRNAHEMLEKEGDRIDSVNVSTPDHSHAGYVLDALRRGLNVYGQKPLCHEIAQCRQIERLAAEKKAITQMGTQIAAWECDRQTAAFLKMGVIGEVRHAWIFSNRGGQTTADHTWPLPEAPVPATLDWKTWLADAPYRPYAEGVYHPCSWRKWRDFGTSWLGDLGLHLLSPIWIGMGLGTTGPLAVTAEIPEEAENLRKQFWPRMSHITWEMPGAKISGGKPFPIEWCDGNRVDPKVMAATPANYLTPTRFEELFAKTPIGKQPLEGRVVEGTEGWLLSVHYNKAPAIVLKNGATPPALPDVGKAPTHWHEYVNACLRGGNTTSSFAWAGRLSEMVLLGNVAMSQPGKRLAWNADAATFG
ncbi:MAG: Gfo/Idh/MocA family oxidoreductase [Kiritimatiellae bacterium]|nr:Gfo/Idh/MocA family oxidoreductase [Kiritimatiellia bacterium]